MRLTYMPDPPKFTNVGEQAFLERLIEARGSVGLGAIYRTLLISPTFAEGFTQFFSAMRHRSVVPMDVRELAMCRVGALNGAAYEWMHHMPLLKKAGVGEEGIETIRSARSGTLGQDGEGGLSGRLWKVLRYVDSMTTDVRVGDEIFDAIKNELDNERQVLELSTFALRFSCYPNDLLRGF